MRCWSLYFISTIALWSVAAGQAAAQDHEQFRGMVVDSLSLAALPAVSVQVKNTARGTITDDSGRFEITASPSDTLVFSRVGYRIFELPLFTYEPGMIRLSEQYTLLEAVTIDDARGRDLYEGLFDEQNARLEHSKFPFWYSKDKKEKIKVERLQQENIRVKTYVDVVIRNDEIKRRLMAKHALTEDQYYSVLRAFNETHHEVMYYLTASELVSLLNTFFDTYAP